MFAALYSIVLTLLKVIVLVAVAGGLIALNAEFAAGEWELLRIPARLRLARITLQRSVSFLNGLSESASNLREKAAGSDFRRLIQKKCLFLRPECKKEQAIHSFTSLP
ncbi:MAG: hypothetical protein ACI399_05210 [Candidatus Cryptobacteroides sp.]